MISILMLTYNAPLFVIKSIISVAKYTKNVSYELIVLDNHSRILTRIILWLLKSWHLIDTLVYNDYNSLFAKGNNIASRYTNSRSKYYLLLNSDIVVKDPSWLDKLLRIHPKNGGISSYGAVLSEPIRADGYCLLINKYLYEKFKLDEEFEWWWSVTKLESQVLAEGLIIKAIKNHDDMLYHYGGASGKGFSNAKGMDIDIDEVKKWFSDSQGKVMILESIND